MTSPEAKIVTGVLVVLGESVTVTPAGMFTVVKLNTPPGGTFKTVLDAGEKAPSAPVLPLLNGPEKAVSGMKKKAIKIKLKRFEMNFRKVFVFLIEIPSSL